MNTGNPYGGHIAFGGAWVDASRETLTIAEAVATVRAAASATYDRDVRSGTLSAALDLLAARGDQTSRLVREFRAGLLHPHPDEREQALTGLAEAIAGRFGLGATTTVKIP
ncbi:MAG: hypothetical protein ACOYM8_15560 [Caulobacterales bacterium]